MPGDFLDTSALAKHYHSEVGSTEIDRLRGDAKRGDRLLTHPHYRGGIAVHATRLESNSILPVGFSGEEEEPEPDAIRTAVKKKLDEKFPKLEDLPSVLKPLL